MAKQTRRLKVGVIGIGFIGRMHAEAVLDIARRGLLDVELTAVAGAQHARGRRIARQWGCAYFEGGRALLDAAKGATSGRPADVLENSSAVDAIDAVIIATPTDTHLELTRAAVAAGKAIFLEKPLGRNLAEARKVATALRRSKRPHQIGLVLRFSPTYNVLAELAADPANGELIFCRMREDQYLPLGGVYDSDWRVDPRRSGGGALLEHSIHDVDILNWFFGPVRVRSARIDGSEIPGIERLAALDLSFEGGGSGQLASIWHGNLARENERHLEFFFRNRMIETEGGFSSPIRVHGPRGGPRQIGTPEIERRWRRICGWRSRKNADFPATFGYELYVFLKSVLDGTAKSAVPVEIGLEAHRVIETAYRMGRRT